MTSRSVTVVNALGLHARAAARFVHVATRFESQIRVGRDTKVMDGKSILGILLLAASRGTMLTVSATGVDETDAVNTLIALVESGFGEEPCSV
jgi:phosphocarrier protein